LDKLGAFLKSRVRVLEHVVEGGELLESLDLLCRDTEEIDPAMRSSILLVDKDTLRIYHAAAPNLPKEYIQAIDGLEAAVGTGSCGTAVKTGERVVVEDVRDHPYWENYLDLADLAGFRACWSQPIFSKDKSVVGTFTLYFDEPQSPSEDEIALIQAQAQLASLVIERSAMVSELKDRDQRLRQSAKMTKIGYWVWDEAEDRAISCSEECARIHGVTVDQYLSHTVSSMQGTNWVHPDDREYFAKTHLIITERHEPIDLEFRLITPNGEVRWVREIVEPEFDQNGVHVRTLGSIQDISEQKKITHDLTQSLSIQDAILSNISQGVSMADPEGHIIAFNKRFLELNDFPPSIFEDDVTYEDLVRYNAKRGHYGSNDVEETVTDRVARINSPDETQDEKILGDGRVVEIRRQPLPDGSIVITDTDVTERYHIENSLRDALASAENANQAKTMFLAAMSHDFRTPLNAIIGFSDLLRAEFLGALGSEKYREYVNDIFESGQLMLTMIDDVLDLSAIEAGKRSLDEQWLNVGETVGRAIKGIKHMSAQRGVDVSMDIPDTVPLLYADERSVIQITHNLLSNAVKYTERDGSITISVSVSENGMTFAVHDTGIGIPPDRLETVTQAFSQAHDDAHVTQEGTGLGLAIVEALATAHHATLSIDSELGKGSSVTIVFPPERVKTIWVANGNGVSPDTLVTSDSN